LYYNFHTHKATNQPDVFELVNQYPQEFDTSIPKYSIGIHPWHIVENRIAEDLKIIEEKLSDVNCLAIGECGLDKRIEIPFELQEAVFRKQLDLAEKVKKPVIIHCVASFQELIKIKNDLKISVPMIIHGFSKKQELAKQLLENGFSLSFGKYLLRNPELKAVFQNIPNDRFLLETDTVEEKIQDIYEVASKYKSLEINNLKNIVETNFRSIFSEK
jgi:TatD DNase family protein